MNLRHTFRHLFLPHHTNNQRPKVLHIDALFGYVLLLLVFNLALRVGGAKAPSILGYATDIHAEQLLAGTNAQRASAGLGALQMNGLLSQAAAGKAQDMFAKGYWAHNSPDGKSPWDFIVGAGYRYTLAGENLAKNFSSSQGDVDAWMSSPTHKENILKGGYREVGFAVVNGVLNGEETTLVVQMFGASQSVAAAPVQAAPPVQVPAQAASVGTPAPTKAPAPTIAPLPAVTPIVIVAGESLQPAPSAFASVIKSPKFDIPTVTREVGFVFMGLLGGVIAVDAAVVRRRQIVRLAGHNIAHMFFLAALLIFSLGISRGSLL